MRLFLFCFTLWCTMSLCRSVNKLAGKVSLTGAKGLRVTSLYSSTQASGANENNPTANTTKVVKIRRSGGKIVQDCDVYIGRRITKGGWNLPQSKWHNPFKRENNSSEARVAAIVKYEEYILRSPVLLAALSELRGKTLGCWCKITPDVPCHGDVLLRLLNKQQ